MKLKLYARREELGTVEARPDGTLDFAGPGAEAVRGVVGYYAETMGLTGEELLRCVLRRVRGQTRAVLVPEEEGDGGGRKSWTPEDEEKHPRDHGKFSAKPGAEGTEGEGGEESKAKTETDKGKDEGKSGEEEVAAAEKDWKENGVRSKAFKSWFGDWENDPENASKVVDAKTGEPQETYGEPKAVYHGSNADFMVFDRDKINVANLGRGFYFTDDPEIASSYATRRAEERGGIANVKKAYLCIKTPLDFRHITEEQARDFVSFYFAFQNERANHSPEDIYRFAEEEIAEMTDRRFGRAGTNYGVLIETGTPTFEAWVSARGYDGLIVPGKDKVSGKEGIAYVAFKPTQIKSTANRGTFDPNDPHMGKSHVAEVVDRMLEGLDEQPEATGGR